MARRHIAGLSALTAAGMLAGALGSSPALGQSTGGAAEAVERCRALPTDSERISCLEQALLAEPSAASEAAEDAPDESVFERRGVRVPGLSIFGGRSGSADPIVTSDSPDADAFGAETVTARQRRSGDAPEEVVPRLVASVVSSTVVPYQRLQVELDNGQVWRQTQSDEPSWNPARDDEPENVEIWPSRLGGYRMLIAGYNRTLKVERVE